MEDRAFFAVQESQPEKVAVEKVQKRPDVQRHPAPESLFRKRLLIRSSEQRRFYDCFPWSFVAPELLQREQCSVPVVFLNPKRNVVLFLIRLNQVVLQFLHAAGNIEMVIHQIARVYNYFAGAEHLKEIFRIISAVLDPLVAKPLPSLDINAIDVL